MDRGRGKLRFGMYVFDTETRTLWKDGQVVPLQEHPAKILGLLLEAPGEVVSRERIQGELWPGEAYGEFTAGVNTAVSKLRGALHDSATRPVYVETVPKVGYRFAAPVQATEAAASAPAVVVEKTEERGGRKGLWIVAAGVVVVAVAASVGWRSSTAKRGLEVMLLESKPLTTFGGAVNRPVFSPDGKTVAFDWDGPKRDNLDIYVLRVGADTPVRVTSDPADENWGVFSPDGSRMAFLRHTEETAVSVFLVPVPGTDERFFAKVARAPRERPRLDWSSDGKWLAVNERTEKGKPSYILLLDAQTGERKVLTKPPEGISGDSEAVFSPGGRQVAFRRTVSSGIEDVYIVGVDGGEPKRVTQDNRGVSAIAWAANGTALLVSSRRRGSTREIWRFPVNGGEPVRLTSPALDAGGQAVSRDGTQVVFVQSVVDTNVYAYPLEGGAGVRVADSTMIDGGPVHSPDGGKFAFRSTRSGSEEFWIAGVDGGNARRLTSFGGPAVGWVKWSPDGRRLAFDVRVEAHSDCYLIDADGSNLRRFHTEPTHESSPSFSVDGKWLYFASNRSGKAEMWRQPLAGGAAERLTEGGGNQLLESPDGKVLYYARREKAGIFALPVGGPFPAEGKPVVMFENGAYGKWAVTKEGVYFTQTDAGREKEPLRVKMIRHGESEVRDVAPMPRQAHVVDGNFSVSPDGKALLIGLLDRSGSGLVLADLK